MGTWVVYISPKGNAETSDDVKYGLNLLFRVRKATVRTVLSMSDMDTHGLTIDILDFR